MIEKPINSQRKTKEHTTIRVAKHRRNSTPRKAFFNGKQSQDSHTHLEIREAHMKKMGRCKTRCLLQKEFYNDDEKDFFFPFVPEVKRC